MSETLKIRGDSAIISNKTYKFALIGNPNCGKTTLFNELTGSNQYVGNWPGVTVEKKEGKIKNSENQLYIVDLPGIYSLSPYSPEEIVTRNYIVHDNPDVIINIVDAANLERNLYLTTQIAELGIPLVIALNMIDVVEKRGDIINYKMLEKQLNIPIIPISASKAKGIDDLISKTIEAAEYYPFSDKPIYSNDVEFALKEIERVIKEGNISYYGSLRWNAIKVFEDDNIAIKELNFSKQQMDLINVYKSKVKTTQYVDREIIIADQRYKYICKICGKCVKKNFEQGHMTISDKIDKVVTSKIFAIPLFLLLIVSMFFITFGPIGSFFMHKAEWLIKDVFAGTIEKAMVAGGASDWAKSLVIDGVIEGVGSVVSFLPQIMILFTLLSILEDSGYMARAAFIMDKLLRKIGLSGRAFVPMLMGFGCTVPAIMGTRILENEKDKRLTILITPFMSCSAKMPVYALFISAFFVRTQPIIILSIYLLGILVAIFTALLFKNTILKGDSAPFVMELPPYRFPTPKTLWMHIWERIKDFLTKAGTTLLAATIVIWFLQSFDTSLNMVSDSSESILARIGTFIAPVFTLCGFGNWQSSVSLLTGLVAKESVISTMSILYNSSEGISKVLASHFSQLSAYSFMTFVLLYTPCVAALSAIKKEMGSTKWTLIAIAYQLAVAWFASAMVFQFGTLVMNILG